MMKNIKKHGLTVVLALVLAGCATTRDPEIPEGAERSVRVEANGDVIEEYRVGTVLRMVKITPRFGVPYYLVDRNRDGRLDKPEGEMPGVYFKIYDW